MDLSNVRIREHYGLVTNDTHTGQFSFLVSPPKNRTTVEKQDYVLIDHPIFGEACPVLGVIKEITSYEEVTGSTLSDRMGKMLAMADIVGYVDLRSEVRPLRKVLVPPNPGSRVYVPLTRFLEDNFNRNAQGNPFTKPVHLGLWEATSAEVPESTRIKCFLDAKDLRSGHTLIASVAGAGKTHTAKVLIQEMAKTSTQVIVFDNYGEYANDTTLNSQTTIINATEKTAKENDYSKIAAKKLTEKENLAHEIKKGRTTIINTRGLSPPERNSLINASLSALLKLRAEKEIEPFFLVIEEAENLKGEALEQIVSEGRKTGISLCLLSSHPTELGGKILSQMSNQIIGRVTDKTDLEYLSNMVQIVNGSLASLAVGECIINGVNHSRPMKAQIRQLQQSDA
jgi:DNA helicase HerA-like ATPase